MRTITVRITGGSIEEKDPSPDIEKSDETPKADINKKTSTAKNIQAISKTITIDTIGLVKSAAQAGYNRYLTLSENYVAQNDMANAQRTINYVTNIASSSFSMAQAFSFLGPIGTAVGAVVGGVIGYAKEEEKKKITLAEQNRQLMEQAYQLYFSVERAGTVNYSRGTEN